MKKLIILLLFIPFALKSQPYIGASLGTYKVATKESNGTTYVLGVHAGYAVSIFFIEGEERIDLLTRKNSNNYFGGKAGLLIPIGRLSISPFVGYYFNYVSGDNTYLNGYYNAYGLKFNYRLSKSRIFVEGINMNTNQIAVGFSYAISSEND